MSLVLLMKDQFNSRSVGVCASIVVWVFVFGSAGMHARTTKRASLFAHGWGARDVVREALKVFVSLVLLKRD